MSYKAKYYIQSARLRTLPLSVSGIILGSLLAIADGFYHIHTIIFAILTALSLQILSNYANELGDLKRGTDNENRVGPIRAIQSGKLTEKNISSMLIIFVIISAIVGSCLVYSAFGTLLSFSAIVVLTLGIFAIWASIKYTLGKGAYGYVGLGDLFVFIFFGLVSVCGVYFLLAKKLNFAIFLPATSIGLLCVAMLNINNMRDSENDANCNKKTMAVRMGISTAKKYHLSIILMAFLLMIIFEIVEHRAIWAYIFILVVPIFISHILYIFRKNEKTYDKQMKIVGIGTTIFAFLSGLGNYISTLL